LQTKEAKECPWSHLAQAFAKSLLFHEGADRLNRGTTGHQAQLLVDFG